MANKELLVHGRLTRLGVAEGKRQDGTEYSERVATLTFDKTEFAKDIAEIQNAIDDGMREEFGKIITLDKPALRDGDTASYKDTDPKSPTFGEIVLISDSVTHLKNAMYLVNMKADKVVLYNTKGRIITWDEFQAGVDDLYVGCYVQAKIALSVYQNKYGFQVSKYINAMTLLRDGDKITGTGSADTSATGFKFASTNDNASFL